MTLYTDIGGGPGRRPDDADQPLNWRVGSGLAHAYPGDRASPLCERHVVHIRNATDNDRRCLRCSERSAGWGVK